MKRLALILALLSLSASAQFIQPVIQANVNHSAITCVFKQNVVTGDPLIAAISGSSTITSPSDTLGSTWASVDSSTAQSRTTKVYVASANGSGADTITWTGSATSSSLGCVEVDKSLYTTTVDVHTNGSYSGTPSTITTSSITPTVDQDLFYAFIVGQQDAGILQPQAPLLYVGTAWNFGDTSSGYKVAGLSSVGVTGTFHNNGSATAGNYVAMTLKPVAITIPTASLPTGSIGNAYDFTLPVVGGIGAYTWSITAGTLPYGLSLNSSTGEITGTPTSGPTSSSITFQATDGTHTATAALTLTINASANTPSHIRGTTTGAGTTLTGFTAAIGDIFVVSNIEGCIGTSFIMTPIDSLGTVYKYIGAIQHDKGASACTSIINIFAGQATASGSDTITPTGATNLEAVGSQFRNVQPFYDTSVFTFGSSTATSTITSSNITTLVPNSMVFSSAELFTSSATLAVVSPFTSSAINNGTPNVIGAEFNLEASVAAYAPAWTQTNNTSTFWTMSALALRPTTGGTIKSPSRVSATVY